MFYNSTCELRVGGWTVRISTGLQMSYPGGRRATALFSTHKSPKETPTDSGLVAGVDGSLANLGVDLSCNPGYTPTSPQGLAWPTWFTLLPTAAPPVVHWHIKTIS